MRSLLFLLLFPIIALFSSAACRPIQPAASLTAFAPDKLNLAQNVAGALRQETTDSLFTVLYPELRTASAPRWLRSATRVTYNYGYATYAQTQDDPTPSGGGLVQYDVVAQNRRNVVFLSTLVTPDSYGQPPAPLSYVVAAPGAGDFWFSPNVLENAESGASDTFIVARLPMTVEGVEYNVVRMQSNTVTDEGRGEEVWAFDTETGILVFYRQALYRNDGSQRSSTIASLISQRRLRLPWRSGTVPQWVEAGLEMEFSGSQVLGTGSSAVPLPLASTSRITRVGALWSEHVQQVSLYGRDAGGSISATGTMQLFGGSWLSPEAIKVLKTGLVLDEDPLSGIQVSVVQANRQRIVLASEGQGHTTQLTYNARNGRLVAIYQEQWTMAGTLYTTLEAVP